MRELIIDLANPDATQAIGRKLGELLFPGAVVGLVGRLGAGKTFLVRYVAEGLGVAPMAVSSPTFVLIQEYPGRIPVYHLDAYRLADDRAFGELGVHDYIHGDGVCLIEWADRVPMALPVCRLWAELAFTGDESRQIRFEAVGLEYERVLAQLGAYRPPIKLQA